MATSPKKKVAKVKLTQIEREALKRQRDYQSRLNGAIAQARFNNRMKLVFGKKFDPSKPDRDYDEEVQFFDVELLDEELEVQRLAGLGRAPARSKSDPVLNRTPTGLRKIKISQVYALAQEYTRTIKSTRPSITDEEREQAAVALTRLHHMFGTNLTRYAEIVHDKQERVEEAAYVQHLKRQLEAGQERYRAIRLRGQNETVGFTAQQIQQSHEFAAFIREQSREVVSKEDRKARRAELVDDYLERRETGPRTQQYEQQVETLGRKTFIAALGDQQFRGVSARAAADKTLAKQLMREIRTIGLPAVKMELGEQEFQNAKAGVAGVPARQAAFDADIEARGIAEYGVTQYRAAMASADPDAQRQLKVDIGKLGVAAMKKELGHKAYLESRKDPVSRKALLARVDAVGADWKKDSLGRARYAQIEASAATDPRIAQQLKVDIHDSAASAMGGHHVLAARYEKLARQDAIEALDKEVAQKTVAHMGGIDAAMDKFLDKMRKDAHKKNEGLRQDFEAEQQAVMRDRIARKKQIGKYNGLHRMRTKEPVDPAYTVTAVPTETEVKGQAHVRKKLLSPRVSSPFGKPF